MKKPVCIQLKISHIGRPSEARDLCSTTHHLNGMNCICMLWGEGEVMGMNIIIKLTYGYLDPLSSFSSCEWKVLDQYATRVRISCNPG